MSRIKFEKSIQQQYSGFKVGWMEIYNIPQNNIDVSDKLRKAHSLVKSNEPDYLSKTKGMVELYKRLNSNARYHISSLIKAVAKGRPYRSINTIVDLVYCVEIEQSILMGLHDLKTLTGDIILTTGTDAVIEHISGKPVIVCSTDIVVHNSNRVMASVTCGPDSETKVTKGSSDILIMVYGSKDETENQITQALEEVKQHCQNIYKSGLVEYSKIQVLVAEK